MNRNDFISATVLGACVFHNACLNFADMRVEEYIQDRVDHVIHNENYDNIVQRVEDEVGRNRRDQIKQEIEIQMNQIMNKTYFIITILNKNNFLKYFGYY